MTYEARAYASRIDAFRRDNALGNAEWADEAGLSRMRLTRYRSGRDLPRADTLARLVRAASRRLHRHVRASELYDLGEDEPVADERLPLDSVFSHPARYGTPFDRTLERDNIAIDKLAAATGRVLRPDEGGKVSRQTLLAIRQGASPSVSIIARLVRTLRRCGYPVTASNIADVGEDR